MTTPWVIMPVLGAPALTEAAINDVLAQTVEPNLLIINQGVDTEFRRRLERIAEFHSPRLFVWSHQPPLPSLAASWNRALQMVWEAGGTEALVINNDLRLRPHTYELLRMALSDQQALFVSAVGVAEEQYRAAAEDDQIMYLADGPQMKLGEPGRRGGPDFSCFLISKEGHQQFPFDEGFIPAYCEDLDMHRRYLLAGVGDRIFSINLPYWHVDGGSGTLKSFTPEQKAAHEAKIGRSRAYYLKKWGGPVNQERYTIPFDPETDQDGVTTPELQRAVQGEPCASSRRMEEEHPGARLADEPTILPAAQEHALDTPSIFDEDLPF